MLWNEFTRCSSFQRCWFSVAPRFVSIANYNVKVKIEFSKYSLFPSRFSLRRFMAFTNRLIDITVAPITANWDHKLQYNLQFPELSVIDDDDFYIFTGRRGLRHPNCRIPVVMNQNLFLNLQLDVDHLLEEHGSGNSACPNGTCENLSSVYSMQCGHPLFCFCCYVALLRHLGISDTSFKCGVQCFECVTPASVFDVRLIFSTEKCIEVDCDRRVVKGYTCGHIMYCDQCETSENCPFCPHGIVEPLQFSP